MPVIEYYPIEGDDATKKNVFAAPTWCPHPRLAPASDPEGGGIFGSARTDLGKGDEAKRAETVFGKNARRLHAATDFLMDANDFVYAPLSGTAIVQPFANKKDKPATDFKMIVITGADGVRSRVLYVIPEPMFTSGSVVPVQAGVTIIGRADNLMRSADYRNGGVPNHVHIDFTDRLGRRFDPYSNEVVERLVLDNVVRPNAPTDVRAE